MTTHPDRGKKQTNQSSQGENKDPGIAKHGQTNALLIIEDEKITYASPAYRDMMGYREGEPLDADQEDIQKNIHPDDKEKLQQIIGESIRHQKPEACYRFREKTRSGKYILREDYARFEYNAEGRHVRTYVVCREVPASGEEADEKQPDSPVRVLIAEDNRMNMMLTQELLRDMNSNLVLIEAWDGQEAVDQFRKHLPEIVLMDINMPEKDGYQAAREIRQIEQEGQRKRAPIIAITARTKTGEKERCLEAGMDMYLPKPLQEQSFVSLVGSFLDDMQAKK